MKKKKKKKEEEEEEEEEKNKKKKKKKKDKKKNGDMEEQFHKFLTHIINTNCSKMKVTKKNSAYVCEDRSQQLSGQPTLPRQILRQEEQPECPCRRGRHRPPHC
jgi:hypothetical protein